MKISIIHSWLICTLLGCLWGTAQARKLHLGNCVVNIHTHELRHHFQHIRQAMVSTPTVESNSYLSVIISLLSVKIAGGKLMQAKHVKR